MIEKEVMMEKMGKQRRGGVNPSQAGLNRKGQRIVDYKYDRDNPEDQTSKASNYGHFSRASNLASTVTSD